MRDMGMMVGTPDELVERLQGFAAAGVGRVYLQLQLHQDLEQLELVAERLAPAFAG
jgi:alkanesulfonate monooxygenase SsuD/methylene tetrahydromethanopterin reductase-like flavin-dependent oxidoreductase (luciferase family)